MPQELLFAQYFHVTEAVIFSLNNPIVKGNSKIPTINGNIISHKFISIKGNTLKIKQCNKIAARYFLLKAETCYGCVSSPIIFLLPKVIPALPIVCAPQLESYESESNGKSHSEKGVICGPGDQLRFQWQL